MKPHGWGLKIPRSGFGEKPHGWDLNVNRGVPNRGDTPSVEAWKQANRPNPDEAKKFQNLQGKLQMIDAFDVNAGNVPNGFDLEAWKRANPDEAEELKKLQS